MALRSSGWPIGTAAHSPDLRQLKRAGVPTTAFDMKSAVAMPFAFSSRTVESVMVSPGVERPTVLPLRSAKLLISGRTIRL